jgi:hypothetical protein
VSYSISISGHKETASEEESKAFEEAVMEKAKEFISTLEGVTSGWFSGGHIGGHDLTAPKAEEG